MSRKAAKKAKPTPRGRQGGRKSKFGTPMISKSLRMREDTWEMIHDGAEAESTKQGRKISQGEWIMMRLYPPHIWAMLNHEPQKVSGLATKPTPDVSEKHE
jgi:ABC-type proline/glycine betaine transport system substrate-binding protein